MRLDIHVHLHTSNESTILSKIDLLIQKQNTMGEKLDHLNTILAEINDSTNNIAADIDTLTEQAKNGISAEDATAFVDKLQTVSTQLKAVAAKTPDAPATTEGDTNAGNGSEGSTEETGA